MKKKLFLFVFFYFLYLYPDTKVHSTPLIHFAMIRERLLNAHYQQISALFEVQKHVCQTPDTAVLYVTVLMDLKESQRSTKLISFLKK